MLFMKLMQFIGKLVLVELNQSVFYGHFVTCDKLIINLFLIVLRQFKGKTPVVGIYQGVLPQLMVLSPEIAKQVMITNFSHFINQAGFGKVKS